MIWPLFDWFFHSAQRWVVEHCSTTAVATRAFLPELPRPTRHRWGICGCGYLHWALFFVFMFLEYHFWVHINCDPIMHLCVSCGCTKPKKLYIYMHLMGPKRNNYVSNCFLIFHTFFFLRFSLFFNGPRGPLSPFPPTRPRWRSAPRSAAEEMPNFQDPEAIDQNGSIGRRSAGRSGWFFGVWIGLCLDMASKLVLNLTFEEELWRVHFSIF